MKKIKAVVLKDATKLTNSQMKEIRGGVNEIPPKPTKCSMQCDSGAIEPEIEFDNSSALFIVFTKIRKSLTINFLSCFLSGNVVF